MKSRIILIGALIMAVLTTVLFRQYVVGLEKKYKAEQKIISIVVPKADIKKNSKVVKENLEIKEVNADYVHPDAVKDIKAIEGSYALIDMKVGEILFSNRFTNEFKESDLITRKIRKDYRAVTIEVNFVESISNLIQPEDFVDVTFSEELQATGNAKKIDTVTLLENVRVLAVGSRIIEKNKSVDENKKDEENNTEVEYNSITVELKPEDVLKIVNADERGNLRFVLRSKIAP